jgi:superfamily II DNA/RNA helicase
MTAFSELGLSPEVLRAVAETGYDTATPIQAEAIPVALQRRDVLGIAQTGTGKTAAFTLPMIDRLAAGRAKARMPRSLVIEPTRELADQVALAFEKYAKYHKLTWALLIGGVSFGDQEKKLDRGVDVLIATPGRLLDHVERGKLLLTGVQILVVDEADRMLDMGFIPDIERIFKLTPAAKQTLFFSATMPPEITRLTTQFLSDPVRIEVSRPAQTADTITQHIARIGSSDPKAKRAALRALISGAEVNTGLVFCNRKTDVDIVAKSLKQHGFDAAPIHGDLDQSTRTRTLEDFRKGRLKLLVASDVAARGLDIPDVSHVFNYDVPHHADDYVHRIGRTGRAGRSGEAFMIVTPADTRSLDKVLKLTKKTPEEFKLDLDVSGMKTEDRGRGAGGRSSERSSERSGGRKETERKPPRGRGRAAPEAEVQAPIVEAEAPEAVAEVAAEPRRTRSRGRGRSAEAAVVEAPAVEAAAPIVAPVPAPQPARTEAPAREYGRSRPREDNEPTSVGFGSDTPAFLLRPTPLKVAEEK